MSSSYSPGFVMEFNRGVIPAGVKEIDDTETSESSTWSSQKIQDALDESSASIQEAVTEGLSRKLDKPSSDGENGQYLSLGEDGKPEWTTVDTSTSVEVIEKLAIPRKISVTGSVTGLNEFDGSRDVEIYTTMSGLTNIELEELLV